LRNHIRDAILSFGGAARFDANVDQDQEGDEAKDEPDNGVQLEGVVFLGHNLLGQLHQDLLHSFLRWLSGLRHNQLALITIEHVSLLAPVARVLVGASEAVVDAVLAAVTLLVVEFVVRAHHTSVTDKARVLWANQA